MHSHLHAPIVRRIGGELRIYDLDLAGILGLVEPTGIRNLLARHLPELQDRGDLYTRTVKYPTATGRPRIGLAYWLNEAQARFLRAVAVLPGSAGILGIPDRAATRPQRFARQRLTDRGTLPASTVSGRIVASGGPVSGAIRTMQAAHRLAGAPADHLEAERRELDTLRGTMQAQIDRDAERIGRCLATVELHHLQGHDPEPELSSNRGGERAQRDRSQG